jgi:hypothetical protein
VADLPNPNNSDRSSDPPNPSPGQDPERPQLRAYGHLYLKALESLRPREYARRASSSDLEEEAIAAQERAEAQEDNFLTQMLRNDPGPKEPHMARVRHYRVLEQQARELALDDMMPEPETSPTSQAATTD